jgi:hypothetical protein
VVALADALEVSTEAFRRRRGDRGVTLTLVGLEAQRQLAVSRIDLGRRQELFRSMRASSDSMVGRKRVGAFRGPAGAERADRAPSAGPALASATKSSENGVTRLSRFSIFSPADPGVAQANWWQHATITRNGGRPVLHSLTWLSLAELISEPDLPTEDLVLLGGLASGRRIALGTRAP